MSSLAPSSDVKGDQDGPATNTPHLGSLLSQLPGDAAQPINFLELLRELQETNRLLRAVVLQKPAHGLEGITPELLTPSLPLSAAASSPTASTSDVKEAQSPEKGPADPAMVKRRSLEMVNELARDAFAPNNAVLLGILRYQCIKSMSWSSDRDSSEVSELVWGARSRNEERFRLAADEVAQVEQQWPIRFDPGPMIHRTTLEAGWILGNNPVRDGPLCATPLFYGAERRLLPANAILDTSQKVTAAAANMPSSNLESPGSLWHFSTPLEANGIVPLRRLALIGAVCCRKDNDEVNAVDDFLQDFCGRWRPLHLRRIIASEFIGWSGGSQLVYQHTMRCFTSVRSGFTDTSASASAVPTYVRCNRESGEFPSLSDTVSSSFVEQRMSVFCRWSYVSDPQQFTIVVLGDFQAEKYEAQSSNDHFTDWEDRNFTVRGTNASYHLLQSVIHRMLVFWEKEWSQCLDELEQSVNTQLNDILNDEASSRLMFDTSFERSRVYFKSLEMLRIFSDTIRETGRELQEMDPKLLLQGSFRRAGFDYRYFLKDDPAKDEALWENWETLVSFHRIAEERLLHRIAEKTEGIKSLRDGLFNATSLREAAKSTTMNRYVIVFTIMTILFLPPSFSVALVSTPLFEGAEDVGYQFTLSTVVVCVVTYALSFVLIILADRWDVAGALYREMRTLVRVAWAGTGVPALMRAGKRSQAKRKVARKEKEDV